MEGEHEQGRAASVTLQVQYSMCMRMYVGMLGKDDLMVSIPISCSY